jgi:hypothetical protein
MTSYTYAGSELELFARAANWKRYFRKVVQSELGDDVLEVGAGIGATAQVLCSAERRRWVCLEPDPRQAAALQEAIAVGTLPGCCQTRIGTLADLDAADLYDSILYIDVLEHIADDRAEAAAAAAHLRAGGKLIVLAPAHQWLFTDFDRALGHFRRYTKRSLAEVMPASLGRVKLRYLDAVGIAASLANRLLLQQSMPNPRQIWLWDKLMVPVSRLVDPLLFYSVGKSVVGVWRKTG